MFQNSNFSIKDKSLFIILILLVVTCRSKISNKNELEINGKNVESSILKNIKRNKTLRVGTTSDFMPFSYRIDSSHSYSGIDIAMAHDFAKYLGVGVSFIDTSWPTLMTDLEQGKFDIAMSGITITADRQKKAFFSTPVYSSGKAAITKDENVMKYTSIDNINKKEVRVIFNPGGTNESFARANFPNATLILNENNISIFQKLVDEQADVMVTDAIETMIQERIHPELDAVNVQKPFNSFDFGYLIQKDSLFKTVLDEWLITRKNDSMVLKLLQKEIKKLD